MECHSDNVMERGFALHGEFKTVIAIALHMLREYLNLQNMMRKSTYSGR